MNDHKESGNVVVDHQKSLKIDTIKCACSVAADLRQLGSPSEFDLFSDTNPRIQLFVRFNTLRFIHTLTLYF